MAFIVTNRGLYTITTTAVTGSTDIRQLVLKGTMPSTATIRDYNTVADLLAGATEAAASGYSRKTLASVTVTEDDSGDQVTITAAAPTYTAIAAGETWVAVGYYIEAASDSLRILLGVDTPASSQATNGGNITGPALSLAVTNP